MKHPRVPGPRHRSGSRFSRSNLHGDEVGVTHVIEYTVALAALLFVLAIFFNAVRYDFVLRDDSDEATDYRAIKILENLVGSTGWAGNFTNGTPDWHTLGPGEQDARMTGVGLALVNFTENGTLVDAGYGICLWDKIIALGNISYDRFKELCNVEIYYQFNITFIPIETELHPVPADAVEVNYGFNTTGATGQSLRERVVTSLKYNSTSGTYHRFAVKIRLLVFRGGHTNERLIINEIYYFGAYLNGTTVEWVEVYNPTPMAINLSYWRISTGAYRDRLGAVDHYDHIIPTGGYGVICSNVTDFLSIYPNFTAGVAPLVEVPDGFIGRNGLPNEEGAVAVIRDFMKSDVVEYNTTHGGNDDGYSVEKITLSGDDFMTDWERSAVVGGTPGERNSVAVP